MLVIWESLGAIYHNWWRLLLEDLDRPDLGILAWRAEGVVQRHEGLAARGLGQNAGIMRAFWANYPHIRVDHMPSCKVK
jgi:hypothetical protein